MQDWRKRDFGGFFRKWAGRGKRGGGFIVRGFGGGEGGWNFCKDGGFYTIVNVGDRMVFEKKHYLFPLATAEILMNPALEQNPGWPKLSTATN